MRLLLFNLVTDADDPVLGFACRWVETIARQVKSVDVLTMRAGRADLPSNVRVHSVGKEHSYGEARRGLEFYRLLARILRSEPVDACFSHMMPLFTVLAGPLLRLRGIPIVTWYTHRQPSRLVRLALLMSDRIVTATEQSFPFQHEKVAAIGHGIDTELFSPGMEADTDPAEILTAGRLSPIKNIRAMVAAAARLRDDGWRFRWSFVGAVLDRDRSYVAEVERQIDQLDLRAHVTLDGPRSQRDLRNHYQRCTVHVNASPDGLFDKTVLEALACGRPSLVTSRVFIDAVGPEMLGLLLPDASPPAIAAGVRAVLSMPQGERQALGLRLRSRVVQRHGLDSIARRVLAAFGQPRMEARTEHLECA
jgi:glycosyltransferase involved in cell wall biosynthesis